MISPTKELIRLHAKQLRMPTFAQYEEVERQLSPSAGYDEFLLELLKRELSERQSSSQKRRIKQARFPYIKTMDEFDCGRCPNVDAMFLRQLAGCDFVKNKSNLVLVGNPGVGKTHLSIALGMEVCRAGYHVRFCSAARLANELTEAADERRLNKLLNALGKVDLLIVDELSYLAFNRTKSELLFQVISERSERASVIVSTNLEFSRWTELFENDMMVRALVDRLTYRSHVLDMNIPDGGRFSLDSERKGEVQR